MRKKVRNLTKSQRSKPQTERFLGLDLSLSPGLAVIDVTNRIPTLIYAGSIATTSDDSDAVRSEAVAAFISTNAFRFRLFDAIIREDFLSGRNKRATQTIFSAWAAADRALNAYGLRVDAEINGATVKRIITGNGKAEKAEVADAVRKILRLPDDYVWAKGNDDSDAAAVVLAWLIREGKIDI
ncbi:crossover junction endodeoxyribonuclease RuvC [Paenibacillus sp. YN15]|uniref:crossover junction endodeoxyribonuclease RuvC n=1 Tax=Paenibacillus sp. YN15 TaxID=1742774 RepID=UPI0015EC32E3|nr:crossover junction endodeoxyribonuclease RuvC [Paenibacillus sp. YN15]